MGVRNLETVLNNLNREIKRIEGVTLRGLLRAGLVVQAAAQKKVPVEFGNLKGSAYTRPHPKHPKAVEVGFNAAYAFYVHENLEQKLKRTKRPSGLGVYWGPRGEPKYLEKALVENHAKILQIITSDARKGKPKR